MAIRKTLNHDDRTREKIKTSQLVNRLQSFAFGEIELERDRVRAIEVLLKKTLPDLQAITHDGKVDHEISVRGALTWLPPQ